MPISVRSITIDAPDPYRIARWWCAAFGVTPSPDDFPDDPEAQCTLGGKAPRLLFERVPERKQLKNRVHIDIQPEGHTRDEEVERLLSLGARLLDDRREPDGTGWVVLADPDGNEFCIERSEAERSER